MVSVGKEGEGCGGQVGGQEAIEKNEYRMKKFPTPLYYAHSAKRIERGAGAEKASGNQ